MGRIDIAAAILCFSRNTRRYNRNVNRSLAAIAVAEAAIIAVLAYLLVAGREGARGDRSRATREEASADALARSDAAGTERGATAASSGTDSATPSPTAREAEAVVWGRVLDGNGAPPPRQGPGWVTFRPEGGDARTALIQEGGWYAIAGFVPGPWTAIATVRGWKTEERPIELAAGSCRLDFALQALTRIAVRFVTPEGTPLVEELRKSGPKAAFFGCPLYAIATKEPPPARLPMTELRLISSYGVGEWTSQLDAQEPMPKGVDGFLLVGEPFPVHASVVLKHIILQTKAIAAPVEEIVFAVRPEEVFANLATVKARFVDAATGAPLKSAQAELNDRQSGGPQVQTDDDGRVVLAQKMPGLMYLTLRANGYEAFQTYVPIRRGGEIDLGTFRVAPAAKIQGRVVDADGKPIPGCGVLARNVEHLSPPQPLGGLYYNQTDSEGVFTIANAGRAQYLLTAGGKGWATHAQILDLRSGDATGLEIRLQAGVLVSVVSKLPKERHCLLTLTDRAGSTYASSLTRWEWPVSYRLAPGAYRLTVRDDESVIQDLLFEVASKPLTLEIGR